MPKLTPKQKREYQDLLGDFNIAGAYGNFIRQWIIFDWTPAEAVQELVHTPIFRRQYPGLLENGELRSFLTGSETTKLSFSSLGSTIERYGQMWESYEQVGEQYGYGNLNKKQVAMLIRNQKSPDEFGQGAYALQQVTEKKGDLDIFNQQLKEMGLKPLGLRDQLKFLARTADQKIYDAYESTRIFQLAPGLDFSSADAAEIAKSLQNVDAQGNPTGLADVGGYLANLSARLSDIGPELRAMGIDNLRVAKFLGNPGGDPELASKIEQAEATKRGRGQYVAGSQPSQGPGGVKLGSNDERTASYG